jgi:peptidoglycan/LPS O-acetylase OafA/YrhL
MPGILGFIAVVRAPRALRWILAQFAAIPALLRYYEFHFNGAQAEFGYSTTATHLRCEGLVLGVLAAHLFHYYPTHLKWLSQLRFKAPIYLVAATFIIILPGLPTTISYTLGYTILAVVLACCVLACAVDGPYQLSGRKLVQVLALTSYSIYLTHPLVIHACRWVFTHPLSSVPVFVQWTLMMTAIIVVGASFYHLVERPTLLARDYIAGRRTQKHAARVDGSEVSAGCDIVDSPKLIRASKS